MCYAAMFRADFKRFEKDFEAEFIEKSWTPIFINSENFKFDTLDHCVYQNHVAPIIRKREKKEVIPATYSVYPPSYLSENQAKGLSTYNCRKENINKRFWSESLGENHGLIVLKKFFEWVQVKDLLKAGSVSADEIKEKFQKQVEERRNKWLVSGKKPDQFKLTATEKKPFIDRKITISFSSDDDLIVPVVFSYKDANKNSVPGFAILTEDPTEEIIDAGHNRMPIILSKDGAKQWLQSEGSSIRKINEVLEMKEKRYLVHSLK